MSFFKKKSQFQGKGRTLADGPKAAPAPAKPAPQQSIPNPMEPNPAPEPEIMPGPGQRFMKVTKAPDGVPAKGPPPTKDEDYKLTGADIKGMTFGQPKTFADVRKVPKVTPRVAKIKFDIRANKTIFQIEAMFATNETINAVYEFLQTEVFAQYGNIEVIQTFPRQVLPPDGKSLVSLKITGSTMLQVNVTGDVQLKI